MNLVSEQTVDFIKTALYEHTKQVEHFCRAEYERAKNSPTTMQQSEILIKQLETLIRTARTTDSLVRAVNLEQLEARADRLMLLLEDAPIIVKEVA